MRSRGISYSEIRIAINNSDNVIKETVCKTVYQKICESLRVIPHFDAESPIV